MWGAVATAAVVATLAAAPAAQEPPAPAERATTTASPLFTARSARRARYTNEKVLDAVRIGIGWLLAHQDERGHWDADGFAKHDPATDRCTGAGNAAYDEGVTALALLAILAQADPLHAEPVHRAADWLVRALDKQEGRVSDASHDYIYSQVVTTMALVEMTALHGDPRHRAAAEAALGYLARHRNANAAWRYMPGDGDNDSSLTAWCLATFAEAAHAGIAVPGEGPGIALGWLDTATNHATGHCGYMLRDEPSSRMAGDHQLRFPPEHGHAMTAAALHARLLVGIAPDAPVAAGAAALLGEKVPSAAKNAFDTYYWFHGSSALAMLPDSLAWKRWQPALEKALLASQCKAKSATGSWDPVDVWGEVSGRIATTAFAILSLSSPWRLERLDITALVPDQPPLRRVHAALRGDKLGEALNDVGRIDVATTPPPLQPALQRARWLLELALAHANQQVERAEVVQPVIAERLAMIEAIRERFTGVLLGDKAAAMAKKLRDDPRIQKEGAAQKDLRPLQKAYDAWRSQPTPAKARQLRTDLNKFLVKHPNTEAAKTAQTWLLHVQ
jgi:hypothetical protein